MKTKSYLHYLFCTCGFIFLVIIDQLSKFLSIKNIKPLGNKGIDLVPGVFKLLYLENRGAAFGMLQNKQWIFIILTFIFLFLMIIVCIKTPKTKRYAALHVIMVFLAAGAVGNFIDRVQYGYVVDFFYFYLIDFPIFNVADIYVTCGAILLFILILFVYKEEDFAYLKTKK